MTSPSSSGGAPAPGSDGIGTRPGVRIAGLYAAFFAAVGIHLPFWPVWLASRGLTPEEIGLLLATPLWARIVGNPLFARVVDRTGRRKATLIGLTGFALLAFLCFPFAVGFWALLAVTIANSLAWSAVLPISENLALLTAYARRLDYGRMRLWGSITFMLASVGGGLLLAQRPESVIVWAIGGALAATFLVSLALPDPRVPVRTAEPRVSALGLLRNPTFLVFLLATGFLQSSHSVYYGFSALDWRAAGISETWIGVLWAVGVLSEVAVFAVSNLVLRYVTPMNLLLLSGAGGLLRWSLTPLTYDVATLVPLQLLHAATFAAAHLGAMHFIARAIPPTASGSAQSFYYAIGLGLLQGASTLAAGNLYGQFGASAYFAMMVMSGCGLLAALGLARLWSGGRIRFAGEAP